MDSFLFAEKSEYWNPLSKLEAYHTFATFTLMLFNSGYCIALNKGIELN